MNKLPALSGKTEIVAVIASPADLRMALADPGVADIYEWRADCVMGNRITAGIKRLKNLGKLIIFTVRDPAEDGKMPLLDLAKRTAMIRKYLHMADIVDIEAMNTGRSCDLIKEIRKARIGLIISAHVLEPTPFEVSKVWLRFAFSMFEAVNADVLKIAVNIDNHGDMVLLRKYSAGLMRKYPGRVAPMAIGESYGKSSRLEYARRGAAFVYCCLGAPVIAGQWQAAEFRNELARLNLR